MSKSTCSELDLFYKVLGNCMLNLPKLLIVDKTQFSERAIYCQFITEDIVLQYLRIVLMICLSWCDCNIGIASYPSNTVPGQTSNLPCTMYCTFLTYLYHKDRKIPAF